MPRARSAFVALAATALLAGCGSSSTPELPAGRAPVQRATLGWVERFPSEGPALVFGADTFEITPSGWSAEVELENRTGIPWKIVQTPVPSFGVMLFTSKETGEVEERSRNDDLPGLRAARQFAPPLPAKLAPGASWHGTISAPGSLAAGLFVRIVYGQLVADGDPPKSMPTQFSWITDHAYELRSRAA
jgi:hypothetical protein